MKKPVIIILIIVFILALAGGLWYFMMKKKQKEIKEKAESSNSDDIVISGNVNKGVAKFLTGINQEENPARKPVDIKGAANILKKAKSFGIKVI